MTGPLAGFGHFLCYFEHNIQICRASAKSAKGTNNIELARQSAQCHHDVMSFCSQAYCTARL